MTGYSDTLNAAPAIASSTSCIEYTNMLNNGNSNTELGEASTLKRAKTHACTVYVARDLDLRPVIPK